MAEYLCKWEETTNVVTIIGVSSFYHAVLLLNLSCYFRNYDYVTLCTCKD